MRDIRPEDLRDNHRLLALLDQAVKAGRWGASEADRLDFIALAERARAQAHNPPAMFRWLIDHRKQTHITQSDEDRAAKRLRELRGGSNRRENRAEVRPHVLPSQPEPHALSETDRLVRACLRVAQQHRIDPFYVVRRVKTDWTRAQWDDAVMTYQHADLQRWYRLREVDGTRDPCYTKPRYP